MRGTPQQIRNLPLTGEGAQPWEAAADLQAIQREMTAQLAEMNELLSRIASALEGMQRR